MRSAILAAMAVLALAAPAAATAPDATSLVSGYFQVPRDAWTAPSSYTVVADDGGLYDPATGLVTVAADGWYALSAVVSFDDERTVWHQDDARNEPVGVREALVRVNGRDDVAHVAVGPRPDSGTTQFTPYQEVALAAGDELLLLLNQTGDVPVGARASLTIRQVG